jgi:hypothetical protein
MMTLRTILFVMPSENVAPSPLTPNTTESEISRPAVPVEMTPAAPPLGCVSATFCSLAGFVPLPLNASEPSTMKLGLPTIVMSSSSNVAEP